MKRMVLWVLLVLSIAALGSAQDRARRDRDRRRDRRGYPGFQAPPAEAVTVTGNMTIVQGFLAMQSGDTAYLVPGLNRYVGFIDSLKDGAQVTLEGSAIGNPQNPQIKALRVTKLTIGGKSYDLVRPAAPPGPPQPVPHGYWKRN